MVLSDNAFLLLPGHCINWELTVLLEYLTSIDGLRSVVNLIVLGLRDLIVVSLIFLVL